MYIMRILVFSDTHGLVGCMVDAVEKYDPAMVIHLGDNIADGDMLSSICTGLPVRQVAGNCDFTLGNYPKEDFFEIGGCKLFICHGHTYGVKGGTERLVKRAKELGAHAALFGHTHLPLVEKQGDIWLANPGTASGCRTGNKTFLLIEVDNGNLSIQGKLL